MEISAEWTPASRKETSMEIDALTSPKVRVSIVFERNDLYSREVAVQIARDRVRERFGISTENTRATVTGGGRDEEGGRAPVHVTLTWLATDWKISGFKPDGGR